MGFRFMFASKNLIALFLISRPIKKRQQSGRWNKENAINCKNLDKLYKFIITFKPNVH